MPRGDNVELISRDRRFLSAAKLHASSVHPGGCGEGDNRPERTRGFMANAWRDTPCATHPFWCRTRAPERIYLPLPPCSLSRSNRAELPQAWPSNSWVLGNQVKSPRPLGLDSRCFIAFLCTFADAALRDDISKPRCRSRHCQGRATRPSPTTTALSSLYPGLSWWIGNKVDLKLVKMGVRKLFLMMFRVGKLADTALQTGRIRANFHRPLGMVLKTPGYIGCFPGVLPQTLSISATMESRMG